MRKCETITPLIDQPAERMIVAKLASLDNLTAKPSLFGCEAMPFLQAFALFTTKHILRSVFDLLYPFVELTMLGTIDPSIQRPAPT